MTISSTKNNPPVLPSRPQATQATPAQAPTWGTGATWHGVPAQSTETPGHAYTPSEPVPQDTFTTAPKATKTDAPQQARPQQGVQGTRQASAPEGIHKAGDVALSADVATNVKNFATQMQGFLLNQLSSEIKNDRIPLKAEVLVPLMQNALTLDQANKAAAAKEQLMQSDMTALSQLIVKNQTAISQADPDNKPGNIASKVLSGLFWNSKSPVQKEPITPAQQAMAHQVHQLTAKAQQGADIGEDLLKFVGSLTANTQTGPAHGTESSSSIHSGPAGVSQQMQLMKELSGALDKLMGAKGLLSSQTIGGIPVSGPQKEEALSTLQSMRSAMKAHDGASHGLEGVGKAIDQLLAKQQFTTGELNTVCGMLADNAALKAAQNKPTRTTDPWSGS